MKSRETQDDIRQRVEESLLDLREGMLVDGYSLEVRQLDPSTLALEIQALENACADCLVPKPIMHSMIEATVPDDVKDRRIELVYPSSVAGDI